MCKINNGNFLKNEDANNFGKLLEMRVGCKIIDYFRNLEKE